MRHLGGGAAYGSGSARGANDAKKDVQVIAFQQTWNTIAKECTSTYGPEDVAYVEVSPPQESIQGTQWWTSYQPVSYKLDSKLGTEAEFKNMIKQCNAVGVDIIADVVLNQTTGADVADGKQAGVAGTEYNGSTGDYPGFATEQYPEGITAPTSTAAPRTSPTTPTSRKSRNAA